jgi:predicted alpha/beta superfamily hydrolase
MRLTCATLLLAYLCTATPGEAQLTIHLTAPADTPAGATIHVAGSFNLWNPNAPGYALTLQPEGGYAITLPDDVRGAIEFKFTLGSWETVETTASGGDVENRSFVIPPTGAATFTGSVAGWRSGASQPSAPRPSTASRSVSILSDSFAIPQLARTRRVWLYLPPDYGTSMKRYPVLYMHDGQNVFDAATSFAGEWGVDESLDSLRAKGDWGAIVVAVDNGGTHRLDEYDPWVSTKAQYGGGEGDAYVEFLVHTLKPYIDQHYRTRPDRLNTAIIGSSMGGLISLYAALKYPDVFGRAGIFSCACWIARDHVFAYVRHAKPLRPLPRLYFVSGALETKDAEPARDQREMIDSLVTAGFPVGAALQSFIPADGKHAEWFWRREFPDAYRWLFHGTPPRAARSRSRGRN